jgi:hypothetical protein
MNEGLILIARNVLSLCVLPLIPVMNEECSWHSDAELSKEQILELFQLDVINVRFFVHSEFVDNLIMALDFDNGETKCFDLTNNTIGGRGL